MATREALAAAATKHLRRADPVMRDLIQRAGPFRMKTDRQRFHMLACSIVSQQLSVKAARTIRDRLVALAGGALLPEGVLKLESSNSAAWVSRATKPPSCTIWLPPPATVA